MAEMAATLASPTDKPEPLGIRDGEVVPRRIRPTVLGRNGR